MFLLFSHKLLETQIVYAEKEFKINDFINLPNYLQENWSQVPTNLKTIKDYSQQFCKYLIDKGRPGDYVLIQGKWRVTLYMVNWCLDNGFIPVYCTAKREYSSIKIEESTIENCHTFNYAGFRLYERL